MNLDVFIVCPLNGEIASRGKTVLKDRCLTKTPPEE
jgi:hypothetical protein